MSPDQLLLISYLSPNLFWYYQAVAQAMSRQCNLGVEILQGESDPLEDPRLQLDQGDLAFLCGLPLIRHNRHTTSPLQLVAAPIVVGDRYQNRPIYFADIVVNATSNFLTLTDLEGTRFCYNDVGSNSGYNLLRSKLLQLLPPDRRRKFFSTVRAAGSHQTSLQWVATGLADCAAIDSVVMAAELRAFPALAQSLRVIESIPSPMPPLVASPRLETGLIQQLQTALLSPDAELQAAMNTAQVRAYTLVQEEDYAPIAQAYDEAIAAGYITIT
jgi:phosphonate transport system substrate-binding protein